MDAMGEGEDGEEMEKRSREEIERNKITGPTRWSENEFPTK